MANTTPRRAIRQFCLNCQGDSPKFVRECDDRDCPLHELRMGTADETASARPIRCIRRYCMICSDGESKDVRQCKAGKTCALWRFRIGVHPKRLARFEKKRRSTPLTLPGL